MISYLRGNIISVSDPLRKNAFVIVDVGGVGYQVFITRTFFGSFKKGKDAEIFTYLHTTETATDLFGFSSFEEVEFFKMLLGISGIGPKTALAILEKAEIQDIQKAVMLDKPELLCHISGLSKKIAEKIVLALKNNIKQFPALKGSQGKVYGDLALFEALESLGFSNDQIRKVISKISPDIKESDAKIKEALRILGRKGNP